MGFECTSLVATSKASPSSPMLLVPPKRVKNSLIFKTSIGGWELTLAWQQLMGLVVWEGPSAGFEPSNSNSNNDGCDWDGFNPSWLLAVSRKEQVAKMRLRLREALGVPDGCLPLSGVITFVGVISASDISLNRMALNKAQYTGTLVRLLRFQAKRPPNVSRSLTERKEVGAGAH
ncbi:hypothetical protein Cgig2_018631 [Carnegiea gigantea]|uniref:Uncharacterized protein n=1 Tax=Carnegiea gigantea TaxID=171969 RepID=A0A9Q1KG80_9CARY|nr:hypothetical protein Cgig2_018631 [Carnegiea gigantea]